jgi:ribonuclease HII
MRVRPNCVLEQELWGRGVTAVAGVDEVGVGALAGPVIAAAVVLAPDAIVDGVADSKLLTPKRREALFGMISERAVAIGIGQVEADEVDRLNIYWAAMEARRRAVDALPTLAAHILVDGKRRIAQCRLPQTAVIGGDALSASIAAASIVAKVTRDALMRRYAQVHPEYGFDRHKGYATANHLNALRQFGPLPFHRHSYAPVWTATGAQLRLALWDDGAQAPVTWQDSVPASKSCV